VEIILELVAFIDHFADCCGFLLNLDVVLGSIDGNDLNYWI
jgi:hypothetical protein